MTHAAGELERVSIKYLGILDLHLGQPGDKFVFMGARGQGLPDVRANGLEGIQDREWVLHE